MKKKVLDLLRNISILFGVLDRNQKRLTILVFFASLAGAALEMLGVSVIIPLVSLMSQPESVYNSALGTWVVQSFHITDIRAFVAFVCLIIILLYVIKNVFFIFLAWLRVKYAFKIRRELSIKVMDSYMQRSYDDIIGKTSAEMVREVFHDTTGVYMVLYSGFRMFSEMMSIILISAFIFITDWRIALCLILLGTLCLLLVVIFFRRRVQESGQKVRVYYAEMNQALLEAFQGIKEVFVMRKQDYFEDHFKRKYIGYQDAEITRSIADESPAFLIEGLCVSGLMGYLGICALVFEDVFTMLPVLAAVAVGAFRILPSIGRISSALNTMLYYTPTVYAVYRNEKTLEKSKLYEQQMCMDETQMDFKEKLLIQNITWRYERQEHDTLHSLTLKIRKGESVGIIGASGAGKSTLIDVILGLHMPSEGTVTVDGIDIRTIPDAWSKMIGYVPQSIYLSDGTLRHNIAFGEDEEMINDDLVWDSLEQAQLASYVRELPDGIYTQIGERGLRFSGGQQQRVAIARALYRKPQILILDEATSALDNETEAAVMDAIEHLFGTITMIIVAHRLSTIRKCDYIYEIKDGGAILRSHHECE